MRKTSKPTSASPTSSVDVLPSSATKVLAALASVAAEQRLRWFLFGAQAVSFYGVARTSADVDVTLEIAPEQLPPFVRAMTQAGFSLRVPDLEAFVATTRVLPFEHLATGWPIDVVLSGPGLEDVIHEGVRQLSSGGVPIPVVGPEHLVALKVLAGRPKDLEDVRGILRQRPPRVDLEEVRRFLRLLEATLDQSDLLPALALLVKDASPAVRPTKRRPGRRR